MEIKELKDKVRGVQSQLKDQPFVVVHTFSRDDRRLYLALTDRLRRKSKGIWNGKAFLSALKNAAYGLDEERMRSRGGQDGIFLVDRSFKPRNSMMTKLFDKFLDKPDQNAIEIAKELKVDLDEMLPVRLVSHHLRLLGVVVRKSEGDWLVLVDYDDS